MLNHYNLSPEGTTQKEILKMRQIKTQAHYYCMYIGAAQPDLPRVVPSGLVFDGGL
jgi:hypothetical protein